MGYYEMSIFNVGDIVVANRTSPLGTVTKDTLYIVVSIFISEDARFKEIHSDSTFRWNDSTFTLVQLTELERELV